MTSAIDLHIHTTASDGSDSPMEVLRKISDAGIQTFSITDHDTIDGVLSLQGQIPEGMTFLPGVEFSCVTPAGKCHILGYGYDPDHPALLAALAEGRQLRLQKLERRLEKLRAEFGIFLTEQELAWLRSLNSPGKPHLGTVLLERGLGPDLDAVIETYLTDVPGRDRIEAKVAVAAIEAAGGMSVWAHPMGGENEKPLTREEFEAQLETLLGYGIRGMECWYSRYDMETVRFLQARAEELGLTVTGGSDYHGTKKKDLPLGRLNTGDVAWDGGVSQFWRCFT